MPKVELPQDMDITEFRSPGLLDGIEREDTESKLDWTKA